MREMSNAFLIGEADFLRKSNNKYLKKEKKISFIKLKTIHIFMFILLITGAGMLAFYTGKFLLSWEKLNIKSFKLKNPPFAPGDNLAMQKILGQYTGNILSLDASALKGEFLDFPKIKDVSINRQLPSTVILEFILREPVFQYPEKGKYRIMDKDGVVIGEIDRKRNDLITLVKIKDWDLDALVACLPELNKLKKSIEYVEIRKPYGLTIKLKEYREVFYPGTTGLTDRILFYLKLKEKLPVDKDKILSVDLRFRNRFYLEFDEEVSTDEK
jgi:cell division septal protein FtsQ